jgi:hypothetical protein
MVEFGVCKLTGTPGRFVKSHLIPRALTRLSRTGEKAFEVDAQSGKLLHRVEGWYDLELVTKEGETILAKCDDEGIRELRRLSLISSAPLNLSLDNSSESQQIDIHSNHPKHLRMFVLSLLWRAGSTQIDAFKHFTIPSSERDYVGGLLLSGETGKPNEFVTVFVSLNDVDAVHNHTPIRDALLWEGMYLPFSRFYFEGLVVHVYDRTSSLDLLNAIGQGAVGFSKDFILVRRPFSNSRQKDDLIDSMLRPEVLNKALNVAKTVGPKDSNAGGDAIDFVEEVS